MERQNATRLTAMERCQMETNRRLEEVMESNLSLQKSNMSLQNMLASMLTNISGKNPDKNDTPNGSRERIAGETSGNDAPFETKVDRCSGGKGSSEQWWDGLCATSEEEETVKEVPKKRMSSYTGNRTQVSYPKC